MQICPKCGAKCAPERHYCQQCGAALTSSGTAKITKAEQAPRPEQTKKRRSLIILAECAAAALVVLLIFLPSSLLAQQSGNDSPIKVVNKYFSARAQADSETIGSLFIPGMLESASLPELDARTDSYGAEFSDLRVYDVTEKQPLDADEIRRELRNSYGISTELEELSSTVAGVLMGEEDAWFTLELARIDGQWYLYRVI